MSSANEEKREEAPSESHDIAALGVLLETAERVNQTTGDDADQDSIVDDADSDGREDMEEDDEGSERNENIPKRKKRTRRVYNGMIECNVEPIRALLTCTLCEGLYREPYTTLKCFHTFCKSCLITAIRASYNTPQYNCCPICQTYFGRDDIVTSNALPDRVLETLIDKVLFPHLSHQDHLLECEFYRKRNIQRKDNVTTTTATTLATTGSVTTTATGNDISASNVVDTNRPEKTRKRKKDVKEERPPPNTILLNNDRDQMIAFQLVPHPTTDPNQSSMRRNTRR